MLKITEMSSVTVRQGGKLIGKRTPYLTKKGTRQKNSCLKVLTPVCQFVILVKRSSL